MHKAFRDLFGSKKATLAALAEIRDRVERLETAPIPDVPLAIDDRLTALSRRDGDLLDALDTYVSDLNELSEQVDGVEAWRKEIVIAVSEGIERTERAERRIKATVQRARKQLAALGYVDDPLEAEAVELRLIDGERSTKSEVPSLPAPVENATPEGSSVRGVSAETLRRARGF